MLVGECDTKTGRDCGQPEKCEGKNMRIVMGHHFSKMFNICWEVIRMGGGVELYLTNFRSMLALKAGT